MPTTAPAFDLRKYVHLRRLRAEMFAIQRAASDALRGAVDHLSGLRAERDRWQLSRREDIPDNLARRLEQAEAARRAAIEHHDEIVGKATPILHLVTRLDEFLKKQGINIDEPLSLNDVSPLPAGNPPVMSDVHDVRARIVTLKAERDDLLLAPVSENETRARINAWLDAAESRLGEMAACRFTSPHTQKFNILSTELGDAQASEDKRLIEALFVLVGRQAIRDKLFSEASKVVAATGGWGISRGERRQRQDELESEIFSAEVLEEQLITRLEQAGMNVARRADADPRAVLAVVEQPAASVAV